MSKHKIYIHRGRSFSVNGISCWNFLWLYDLMDDWFGVRVFVYKPVTYSGFKMSKIFFDDDDNIEDREERGDG